MDLETVVKACVASLVEILKGVAAQTPLPFDDLAALWAEHNEGKIAKEMIDKIFNVYGPNPTREQIRAAVKSVRLGGP